MKFFEVKKYIFGDLQSLKRRFLGYWLHDPHEACHLIGEAIRTESWRDDVAGLAYLAALSTLFVPEGKDIWLCDGYSSPFTKDMFRIAVELNGTYAHAYLDLSTGNWSGNPDAIRKASELFG